MVESRVFTATPTWELVKQQVFYRYENTLDSFQHILAYSPARSRDIFDFKSGVFSLYVELAPKLKKYRQFKTDKHEIKTPYKELISEMDALIINSSPDLTIEKAKRFFIILRYALEELGYTRVEFEQKRPGDSFGVGLEESHSVF